MTRAAWMMALAILALPIGCGSGTVVAADAGPQCSPEACDDGNPCTTNGCAEDGGCARISLPKGTTCEGTATDPIHGECNGDHIAPSCGVQEWTCLRNPPGTPCIGGLCAGDQICCSGGCLNAANVCTFGAGSIGKDCPKKDGGAL